MTETFFGYIDTTQDVLLIFEGCRRGLLPRVCRRLQEKERRMIRSGSVFVFDEKESGIKRWTDGLVWSPSRILGNFLIYRELDKKLPGDRKLSLPSYDTRRRSIGTDQSGLTAEITVNGRERRLVGSLSDSYRFRKDGLIKKTMSIVVNGISQHLISYYHPNDIRNSRLRTPSAVPELASLEISPDLLIKQNFRIPPVVEPSYDQNGISSLTGLLSPVDTMASSYSSDKRVHSFRSMSLGSLHPLNGNFPNPGSNSHSRPDVGLTQMIYNSSLGPQRIDMNGNNSNSAKLTNNLSAYYGNGQSFIYNTGCQPLPSPSSMTSSPNTPMLSPVRHSFPQQNRSYPITTPANSSGLLQRLNGRNSYDMMTMQPDRSQSQSIHPHMIPDTNMYNSNERVKIENIQDPHENQGFSSSPNIGQLLNPVNPLNTTTSLIKSKIHMNDTNQQQPFFQSIGMTTNTIASNNSNNNSTTNYSDMSSMLNSRSTPYNTKSSLIQNTSHPTHDHLMQHNISTSDNGNSMHNTIPNNSNNCNNGSSNSSLHNGDHGNHGYNSTYNFYNQRQSILNNTHPVTDNTMIPIYRNGIVHSSSSMYDNAQSLRETGPEHGMEPLMLK
ncbi:Gti1/Pac2 family-domain-containing protein [Pilobolus umbonatus]|nr:Gti1/Pac2 family-domain-containing protein [Pilobolus umbonatus]